MDFETNLIAQISRSVRGFWKIVRKSWSKIKIIKQSNFRTMETDSKIWAKSIRARGISREPSGVGVVYYWQIVVIRGGCWWREMVQVKCWSSRTPNNQNLLENQACWLLFLKNPRYQNYSTQKPNSRNHGSYLISITHPKLGGSRHKETVSIAG